MSQLADCIDSRAIEAYAELLFQAWRLQRQVFVFGNGGSASTASHHVCDYVKTAAVGNQPRLRAFCLSDNVGLSTAVGNDNSYDDIFAYPLAAYARPGDVAVAISCSGNSPNVIRACQWALSNGVMVVGLTGFSGGALKSLANVHIHVPSDNFGIIEDLHLSVGHVASQLLKCKILLEQNPPLGVLVPTDVSPIPAATSVVTQLEAPVR
jgi:D-sedoheptulose 7-phosphate isomerase